MPRRPFLVSYWKFRHGKGKRRVERHIRLISDTAHVDIGKERRILYKVSILRLDNIAIDHDR